MVEVKRCVDFHADSFAGLGIFKSIFISSWHNFSNWNHRKRHSRAKTYARNATFSIATPKTKPPNVHNGLIYSVGGYILHYFMHLTCPHPDSIIHNIIHYTDTSSLKIRCNVNIILSIDCTNTANLSRVACVLHFWLRPSISSTLKVENTYVSAICGYISIHTGSKPSTQFDVSPIWCYFQFDVSPI